MGVDRIHHVLITVDTVGGVWHYGVELAAGLSRRGVRVSLATVGARLSPAQRAEATRLQSLHRIRGFGAVTLHESDWRLEWMEGAADEVCRAGDWLMALEARLRPDVVHLNQFAFGAWPFSAPTLLVAHSCVMSWWRAVHRESAPPEWDTYRDIVRRGLEGAALIGAPTRAMLKVLAREHGVSRQGLVLPNGRSATDFRAGNKQPIVLSAGRLWDRAKNLSALERVASRLPWQVRVAGASAEPGRESADAEAKRASDAVQRLGDLPSPALAAEFAQASIYALPARYEPFGLSVLEAGLSGCALVLGDLASLREVWGDAAFYVPPDDTEALHAALMRLIDDPALRERMARRASVRARRFTPARMVDAYLGAYAQLHAPKPIAAQELLEASSCDS